MANKMQSIEESLVTLEQILEKMSLPQTTLEESIELYAQAAQCIQKTSKSLEDAKVKIEQIDETITQLRNQNEF